MNYTTWVRSHNGEVYSVVTNGGIMLARIVWDALQAKGVEMVSTRP